MLIFIIFRVDIYGCVDLIFVFWFFGKILKYLNDSYYFFWVYCCIFNYRMEYGIIFFILSM